MCWRSNPERHPPALHLITGGLIIASTLLAVALSGCEKGEATQPQITVEYPKDTWRCDASDGLAGGIWGDTNDLRIIEDDLKRINANLERIAVALESPTEWRYVGPGQWSGDVSITKTFPLLRMSVPSDATDPFEWLASQGAE